MASSSRLSSLAHDSVSSDSSNKPSPSSSSSSSSSSSGRSTTRRSARPRRLLSPRSSRRISIPPTRMTRAVSTLGSSSSSSSEPEGRSSSSTESEEVSESWSGLRTRRPPALGPYAPNIWRCLRLGPPPPRSATNSASPSSGPYRPPLPPPPTWLFESDAGPPPRAPPPRPRPRPPSPRPRPRPPRPPRPADLWRPPILAHSGTQDYASLGNAERLDRRHVLRQSPVRREAKFRAAHPSRPDVGKSAEKANASGGEVAALRARNYMYETRFRRYLNTRHAPSSRAPSSRASSFRFTARCTLSFHSSRRLCISSNCSFDCSWVGDR